MSDFINKRKRDVGKVSILGVESLVPFCVRLLQKKTPIIYNFGVNKIVSK